MSSNKDNKKLSETELLKELAKFEETIKKATENLKLPETEDNKKTYNVPLPPQLQKSNTTTEKPPQKKKKVVTSISAKPTYNPQALEPTIETQYNFITPPTYQTQPYISDNPKKRKKFLRTAAGEVWEDETLSEWPDNDYRIFVGDLGNDVTTEMLARAFNRYKSFAKAKVIRDKRTNKSKGYGFVSFLDPEDYAAALEEMNGKYIGNRPCKLRKSKWQERNAKKPKRDPFK